MDYNKH